MPFRQQCFVPVSDLIICVGSSSLCRTLAEAGWILWRGQGWFALFERSKNLFQHRCELFAAVSIEAAETSSSQVFSSRFFGPSLSIMTSLPTDAEGDCSLIV